MEERRVVDYFVVVGASDEQSHDDINSTHLKQSLCSDLPPITDLAIVFPSLGEKVPSDFIVVDTTPSGLIADLNHGSLRSPEVFLCYRRGRDKPPIVDIGIMYDGKERVLKDAQVLKTTVSGEVANINNSTSSKTFITYRRALPTAPCNILAVSHICVVITSRGETPPHAFCLIHKNLNKGMVGSDVYLCYKKSVMKPKSITYKPVITNRYPKEDRNYFHLLPSVALFCLPMGATLEAWPNQASQPKPVFSTFVLTVSDASEKVYGAAITFYEKFSGNLSNEQKELLGLNEHHNELKNGIGLHSNKSICVLSHWPFFDTFEKFLMFLLNTSLGDKIHIPVERYITHLVDEVPFPSPERPQILVQLSMDTQLILTQPEDLPIPRSGAGFHQMIMNLHPDNCLLLLLCALTEQKLLIHSLRPDVLTAVAEAISSLIFPFKWQCPYIPLCPLSLAEVLHAPLPFLIGVDSRFFDLYEPPTDVTCVDLDTNTVTLCEDKKYLSIKLLPKKSARVLKYTLEKLYEKLDELQTSFHTSNNKNFGETSIDKDILMKRKEHELELNIQEAFLRFMGSILKGYRWFLRPITKAPTAGTTDTSSLFDLLGFLKSRDKSNQKFYSLLTKTQMFIRFIEERSFVSNMDAALEFFDECSEKIDSENSPTRLIELDSCGQSERTVFIMPPEMSDMPNMVPYSYKNGFILNSEILKCKDSKNQLKIKNDDHLPIPGSPMARRTKHEVKSAQKLAKKYSTSPGLWAKFLLGTCYSLWFIHLPSHILQSEDRAASILRLAYDLLNKFQKNGVQRLTDEVCYRVMMQLCGIYNQPMLAVKLLLVMKRCGLHPNAITYGFYNRALLESTWPSDLRTHSQLLWNKLRNVVICTALFKQAGLQNRKRRSSTEDEKTSHTSEESLLTAEKQSSVSNTPRKLSINVESNYGLRARPISIVKQNSLSPEDDQSWSSQQFESSAGLLMTTTCSRPSSASSKPNSDSVSVESETDLKRGRSGSLTDEIRLQISPRRHHYHQPLINTSNDTSSELLKLLKRSKSFGNDAQILKNLNDLKYQTDFKKTNGISKKLVFDNSVKSFDSSLENLSEENTCNRFPEAALCTPVLENDPLGALQEPLTPTLCPLVTPISIPRVQSGIELDRSGSPILFREWGSIHRSATFSDNVGNIDNHMQRSSTMPAHSIKEPEHQQSPIKISLGSAFKIPFSPSSFSGKKSNEILMGGLTSLKSAANTVVKKFDEIKEAISTNNTPIKDYIQCSKDEDKWIDDVDHQFNEPSVRRKISSEISSLAVAQHFDSWSTNLIELFTDGHKKSGSCNINSGFDTLDFSELSLFQEKLYQRSIRTTELVALEIIMTTCSKCHNCGCLLFDEEIMSGWVPDDSNLNTKCRLCNKDVVPFLTIDIIDYRSKDVYLNEIDDQNKISNFNLLTDNVKEKGTSKNCYRTDTITVPYLNPLVLRKELESILAAEGDVSLTHYKFVDEHPIIYWNLVWIFERIDVPSHISGLCLNAASILGDRDITTFHSIWSSCDSSNVLIINLWDNPKLYDDIGLPMYSFWSNEETKESCLISALVTDRNTIPKNLMTKVIASIRRNNLTDPLKKLAFERNKLRGNDLSHSHSLYRDILFLTITAIGRENIDISAFDQEYLIAFENLSENESKILLKCDHPISIGSQYCRHLFKELELSNYK
ncbi:DENN domain-containing protein Crag isoform X2 [Daktulosphaira vitifoliae]|uniref:DENN domain-containing protein Crag isoform X2 n=1 Tax=Daktulosphaira vitifoliae TaxID=58002 RepID=UPI0021AA139B|nr:DENN domain-containing protein Crag isoform X2 [Daktulosphaira vitifoliae]